MSLGHHICFRAQDDRVIAPSDEARRKVARAVNQIFVPEGLLAFRIADTHGHIASMCDRERGGQLARRLEIALAKQLKVDCGLHMSSIKPIETQQHLHNAVLYVLRQRSRHGLESDPYHEGSSLPDLLGARVGCEPLIQRVREYLPRIRRGLLLEIAGVGPDAGEPNPAYLPEAAAAATALPNLAGRLPLALHARVAVVRLAEALVTLDELAELLGTTERAVRRLRRLTVPAPVVKAVRAQALLREAIDRAEDGTGSRGTADRT